MDACRQVKAQAEDGASAVEYGLLVAGIAGMVAAIVFLFGDTVMGLFDTTCANIADSSSGSMSVDCSAP